MNLVIVERKTLAYAVSFKDLQRDLRLGLGFLARFTALGFQLRELIGREYALRFLQKRLPAFFGAARFHALRLPRFDLALLVRGQIQTRKAGARFLIGRALGTTRHVVRFVLCKRR
jgi:hypothetical protein